MESKRQLRFQKRTGERKSITHWFSNFLKWQSASNWAIRDQEKKLYQSKHRINFVCDERDDVKGEFDLLASAAPFIVRRSAPSVPPIIPGATTLDLTPSGPISDQTKEGKGDERKQFWVRKWFLMSSAKSCSQSNLHSLLLTLLTNSQSLTQSVDSSLCTGSSWLPRNTSVV